MDRWWEHAACSGVDTNRFFQKKIGRRKKNFTNLPDVVFEFCVKCPVKDDCLKEAMRFTTFDRYANLYGVWGGTTAPMRRQILKNHGRRSDGSQSTRTGPSSSSHNA